MISFIRKRAKIYSYLILFILIFTQLLAPYFYFLELFTHFSFHGFGFIFILSFFIKNKEKYILALISLIFISSSLIFPLSYWQENNKNLKIISYNLNIDNPKQEEEFKFLLKEKPDILALIEVGGISWKKELNKLSKNYPYNCGFDENSPFGMFLFSKINLKNCEVKFINEFLPYIIATLEDNKIIYLIHPPAPVNKDLAEYRTNYFEQLAIKIKGENNLLVVGDFNNSYYSPIYRKFLNLSQTKDLMPPFIPSWRPFYLPIDRVISKGIKAKIKPLKFRYSDHRGLLINF